MNVKYYVLVMFKKLEGLRSFIKWARGHKTWLTMFSLQAICVSPKINIEYKFCVHCLYSGCLYYIIWLRCFMVFVLHDFQYTFPSHSSKTGWHKKKCHTIGLLLSGWTFHTINSVTSIASFLHKRDCSHQCEWPSNYLSWWHKIM